MAKKTDKPKKPKVITKGQFQKWSPEHQQRALNDRRIRIRIADDALPKEWYDKRVESRYLRSPITPGASETGRELDARRARMETLTFGEGESQLRQREQNQQGLEDRGNAWFEQYRNDVKAANERAASGAAAAGEAGRQMVQGVTTSAQADRDRVATLLRDQAAQLGQPSQEGDYRKMADAGIAARGAELASSANAQNAVAAAAADYAAARVDAAGLADAANRQSNVRRRDVIASDKKDYADKKSAWREKFIADAISEARKQVIEDRLAVQQGIMKQAEIDLKNRTLQETIRNNKTQAEIDRERERRLAASGGSSGGGSGGGKSKNPKDKYKTSNENLNRAISTLVALKAKPNQIISQSKKGAARGSWQKYGVEYYIRKILGENKTSNISREVAKRAIYLYIQQNGRVPGNMDITKAPKSPPWK